MPGVYSFYDQHTIQHNMVQTGGQTPQGMHIPVCIMLQAHQQVYLIMFMIQPADPVIHYQTLVALYPPSGAQ